MLLALEGLKIKVLGEKHHSTFRTSFNLAYCLWNRDLLDQVKIQLEDLISNQVEHLGEKHPDTLKTHRMLEEVVNESDVLSPEHSIDGDSDNFTVNSNETSYMMQPITPPEWDDRTLIEDIEMEWSYAESYDENPLRTPSELVYPPPDITWSVPRYTPRERETTPTLSRKELPSRSIGSWREATLTFKPNPYV
jgi:hypothetical protein